MKQLRKFLDSVHPLFAKGGKLEKLYPLYEAGDTFLYTPGEVTENASHVRDGLDLKRMMITVVGALGPCILMALYNTGYQANLGIQELVESGAMETATAPGWRGAVMNAIGIGYGPENIISCLLHGALYFFPVFLVANIAGGMCEGIFSSIRGHEINEGFLVTGMLYPLTLPPTIPLWQVALGIIFAVVIAKEIYGGTGMNFLNIALTARAFLYFAYPAQISGDAVWVAADGYTGATALGAIAAATPEQGMAAVTAAADAGGIGQSWMQSFIGTIAGSMGETSTLACLLGAAILIGSGIGSWRIMAGVMVGMVGLSGFLFGLYCLDVTDNPMYSIPPWWHLVIGGFAFGTVFMATDPVSASMTEAGKWVYGILIGVMTVLIRAINPAFPEGIMLAILFGNVFAPTIDYFVVQANINRRMARNAAA